MRSQLKSHPLGQLTFDLEMHIASSSQRMPPKKCAYHGNNLHAQFYLDVVQITER